VAATLPARRPSRRHGPASHERTVLPGGLRVITQSMPAARSVAAGLFVGGKTPIILIQNTGMLESGDSLRGWTQDVARERLFVNSRAAFPGLRFG